MTMAHLDPRMAELNLASEHQVLSLLVPSRNATPESVSLSEAPMSDSNLSARADDRRHAGLFAAQRMACRRRPYPELTERKSNLRRLKRQLHRYQDLLVLG